ncbi:MAG: hypothetical protein JRC60_00495 [Deltaproteobacteria bacterium]|nr:hypothetical protein [Deltaproteobacteria bacterium]
MRVETDKYIFNTGKIPRGYGMWAFEIRGKTIFITGNYADAKKEAIKEAKRQDAFEIAVLP